MEIDYWTRSQSGHRSATDRQSQEQRADSTVAGAAALAFSHGICVLPFLLQTSAQGFPLMRRGTTEPTDILLYDTFLLPGRPSGSWRIHLARPRKLENQPWARVAVGHIRTETDKRALIPIR
jgi:hypothetical protein